MNTKIKNIIMKLRRTRFVRVLSVLQKAVVWVQYGSIRLLWQILGKRKTSIDEIEKLVNETTIIYKSFERQKMAKRLYKNICKYYPGIKVIIADDSAQPLELQGDNLQVIQLPFNSGLSYGINRALEQVTTPFVIRMDDDELLTPFSQFEKQLDFLKEHSEVDLVGVLPLDLPYRRTLKTVAAAYYKQPMNYAPKPLKIPHLTQIDETHCVLGKVPNVFIARTDKLREIGYDDKIRMIDHNEFFYRAAGNLVAALDASAYVIHYHDWFDMHYSEYRSDYKSDQMYIREKIRKIQSGSQNILDS